MARTKASVGAKLSSGKSSKARNLSSTPSTNAASPSTSKGGSVSGNSYCPRPTPNWQKPITNFFIQNAPDEGRAGDDDIGSSGSALARRRNRVLNSETESDGETEELVSERRAKVPENDAASTPEDADITGDDLDSSNVELAPLTDDENSHKIVEYFHKRLNDCDTIKVKLPQSAKGKGKGKKSSSSKSKPAAEGSTSIDVAEKSDGVKGRITDEDGASKEDKENKMVNGKVGHVEKVGRGKAEKHNLDEAQTVEAKRIKIS